MSGEKVTTADAGEKKRAAAPSPHVGLHAARLRREEGAEVEKAFAEAWELANRSIRGVNGGYGVLEMLLSKPASAGVWSLVEHRDEIIRADGDSAVVAATVIQWLGTNVGMSFLRTALEKAGYKLVPDPGK